MLRPLDVTDGPAKPTASSGACQQNGQQQECDQQRSCGARSRQQRRDHDERGEDRPSAHGERGDRRLRSEIVSAARIGALRLRASGAHQRRAHPCRSRAAGRRGRAGRERQLDFRHVAVIDRHRAVRDERSGRRTNNGGAPQAPVRVPGPRRPLGNREWSILRVRRRRTEHRLASPGWMNVHAASGSYPAAHTLIVDHPSRMTRRCAAIAMLGGTGLRSCLRTRTARGDDDEGRHARHGLDRWIHHHPR